MNKTRISAYMMSLAALGLWSCSGEGDMPGLGSGRTVHMTVDVSRSTEGTRTALEQVEGDLSCVWTEGDKLLVTATDGTRLGVLDLKQINETDKSKATFDGTLENVPNTGSMTVNYIYLGNKGDYTTELENKVYSHDYSAQTGTIDELSDHDIMTVKKEGVIVDNGASYVADINMERRVSFARFKLTGLDGVNFGDGSASVYVSGESVNNVLSVNGGTLEAAYTAGGLTITPTSNDFYMTLLPNTLSGGFDLKFTVSTTDATYEGVYKVSKTIAQGKFYRKNNSEALEVPMTKAPTVYNPGDMGSWGGVGFQIEPSYTDTKDTSKKYRNGGWCDNNYSLFTEGGWCDPIIYHWNGIINGAMYSTRNTSPSYYQWGRWMGFPYNDNMLIINSFGQPVNDYDYWAADNAFALGESIKDNGTVRYQNTQYGSVYGGYFALMSTTWYLPDGWDNDMAIKSSIIFGGAERQPSSSWQDYLKTNENCKWQDRAGNPCPDGWRIPTLDELKALIPGGGSTAAKINGSYAEVRVVNGVKYAFCYKVETNDDGIPCLNIYSVKTDKTSVTVSDPIFNNSKYISIGAYGLINYEGARAYYGNRAYIWSSESGQGGNLNGYAGAALRVVFDNNSATISTTLSDRINAAMVFPIRDDAAVHTDIRPWFPHFTY